MMVQHLLLVVLIGILSSPPSFATKREHRPHRRMNPPWLREAPPVAPIWFRESPHAAPIWLLQPPHPVHLARRDLEDEGGAPPAVPPSQPIAPPPPPNGILPNVNPVKREIPEEKSPSGGSPRQMARSTPGKCLTCDNLFGKCIDDEAAWQPIFCDPTTTASDVRCMTIQVFNKGTAKDSNNKHKSADRFNNRYEIKHCIKPSGVHQDLEECALQELNLKLEDGKCIKGTYALEELFEFRDCIVGRAGGSQGSKLPDDSDTKGEGFYFGEYGRRQYAHFVICSCKGEECNKEDEKILKSKSSEASPAARKGQPRVGILHAFATP